VIIVWCFLIIERLARKNATRIIRLVAIQATLTRESNTVGPLLDEARRELGMTNHRGFVA